MVQLETNCYPAFLLDISYTHVGIIHMKNAIIFLLSAFVYFLFDIIVCVVPLTLRYVLRFSHLDIIHER